MEDRMSEGNTMQAPQSALPTGRWQIEPTNSQVGFTARGVWGLAAVKGPFGDITGTLDVEDDGAAHGTLEIAATSLDTGNAKRDAHLRSPDFFDVENHPTVTFSLRSVAGGQLHGVLSAVATDLELDAPLTVELVSPEHLTLSTATTVDRKAAGLGWSKFGMIQGKAHLNAKVKLVPAPRGS
jgi:polyisoprenoid-binding protein YceI